MKNIPAMIFNTASIYKYCTLKSKVFWNIVDWNRFYKDNMISFAFGTRFHGNMAALRNCVPSLWITHDSRTKELVDFLHLSNLSLDNFIKIKYIEELFEYCDFSELRKNYKHMCIDYASYLNENGIENYYNI